MHPKPLGSCDDGSLPSCKYFQWRGFVCRTFQKMHIGATIWEAIVFQLQALKLMLEQSGCENGMCLLSELKPGHSHSKQKLGYRAYGSEVEGLDCSAFRIWSSACKFRLGSLNNAIMLGKCGCQVWSRENLTVSKGSKIL